jgi:addiction module HigA family antidote
MPIKLHANFPVHPEVRLRSEFIEPHKLSVTTTVGKLHVTRQAMSTLPNGKAGLSPEMAIRFEKAFGIRADTLMRMQASHDLAIVQSRERDIIVEPITA